MKIETFQKNFQIRDINTKPYLIVVSIFIVIILLIVLLNNKIEDYYICDGKVKDNKLSILVDSSTINKITENKKMIIERNIFTYEVIKINEISNNSFLYYELILELDKIPTHLFIDNNIINLKIITKTTTIFDYLIKTIKGEWHINKISKDELQEINGGGISLLGIAGIVAGVVFVVGVIDGYVQPKKCNE